MLFGFLHLHVLSMLHIATFLAFCFFTPACIIRIHVQELYVHLCKYVCFELSDASSVLLLMHLLILFIHTYSHQHLTVHVCLSAGRVLMSAGVVLRQLCELQRRKQQQMLSICEYMSSKMYAFIHVCMYVCLHDATVVYRLNALLQVYGRGLCVNLN
jgi:hypothetical protein